MTKLHRIAVTIAGKPGTPATLLINDTFVDSAEVRGDGLYDFINVEVPSGPIELKLQSKMKTGMTMTTTRTIHVLGAPSQLHSEISEIVLPADGFASQEVRFEIQDDWGYRIDHIKIATVSLTNGWLAEADADSISTGHQVKIENGFLSLTIQAADHPGTGILEISLNGHYHQYPVKYEVPAEPFILVGMANGSLSQTNGENDINMLADMDPMDKQGTVFESGDAKMKGRTALYAAGTVSDDIHISASFDSDRNREDQFMDDFELDSQYPIYGDAGTLEYDAQAQSKLYARIEKDGSHLLLGDFTADMGSTEFTAYNRTFTGLTTDLNWDNSRLTGFISKSDHSLVLDRIMGEGISGYYNLSSRELIRFSEHVSIETRDKYHSERVLESKRALRYTDYDIDYENGTLMFKQPVPAVDGNGNPIYIVVNYEVDENASENYVGGIRYENLFLDKYHIGGSFITEEQDVRNFVLSGLDARIPMSDRLAVKAEAAVSRSLDEMAQELDGTAWKTEFTWQPTAAMKLDGYYRNVDSSFVNNSQTSAGSEKGSTKYGFSAKYRSSVIGQVSTDYYYELYGAHTADEETREVISADINNQLNERTHLSLGLENARITRMESDGTTDERISSVLTSELAYRFSDALDGSLETYSNLNTDDKAKPNSLLLGLGYTVSEKVRIFFKHRLVDHSDKASETIFGLESKVSENMQIDGKYEIGGALGENRSRASIGLRNKWSVRDDLTFNLAYENTATFDDFQTPVPEHDAVSMSFEYFPEAPYKLTGKFENRRNETTLKRIYGVAGSFRMMAGLSLLAKTEHTRTDYRKEIDEYIIRGRIQAGLAYRPEMSDIWNMVGKLEYITDRNTHVDPEIRSDRLITALNMHCQPVQRWSFSSRLAYRRILDESGDLFSDWNGTAYFYVRPELDITPRWSTALDLRTIWMDATDEQKLGTALELNYLLRQDMQLGLGYTFLKYEDPDFSSLDQQLNRLYVTFHLNFSESLFDLR